MPEYGLSTHRTEAARKREFHGSTGLRGQTRPGTQSAGCLFTLSLDKVRQFVRFFRLFLSKGAQAETALGFNREWLEGAISGRPRTRDRRESSCRDWGKCLACQKDNPPTPVPWKHNPGLCDVLSSVTRVSPG